MEMLKIDVGIQGITPGLLMASKRIMDAEKLKKGVRRTPEEDAELHCHWITVGKKKVLAIPWVNIYNSVCAAGTSFTYGKKSMATLLAATLTSEVDMISLGTDQYEVFSVWGKIPPRTGGMVKISRPRISEWKASFVLVVDPEMYSEAALKELEKVLNHAGKMIGIGPWRPQLKGPYGRFFVTQFKIR